MNKKEFTQRCKDDPEMGAYFAYAIIIAECLLPIKEDISQLIQDKDLYIKVCRAIHGLQPLLAHYLVSLETH